MNKIFVMIFALATTSSAYCITTTSNPVARCVNYFSSLEGHTDRWKIYIENQFTNASTPMTSLDIELSNMFDSETNSIIHDINIEEGILTIELNKSDDCSPKKPDDSLHQIILTPIAIDTDNDEAGTLDLIIDWSCSTTIPNISYYGRSISALSYLKWPLSECH